MSKLLVLLVYKVAQQYAESKLAAKSTIHVIQQNAAKFYGNDKIGQNL